MLRRTSMMVHWPRAAAHRTPRGTDSPGSPAAGAAGFAALSAALFVVFAGLTGCGSQHAGLAGGGSPRPSGSGPAGQHTASLTIQVTPGPGSAVRRWTLHCGPPGGSLRGAAAACTAVARTSDPFGPVPRGTMCSMVYGGPQTALVTGTWQGKAVNARYSRTNSCQTARWDKLASMFPAALAGTVTPVPTAPGGGQVNPGGPIKPAPGTPAAGTSGTPGGAGGMSG